MAQNTDDSKCSLGSESSRTESFHGDTLKDPSKPFVAVFKDAMITRRTVMVKLAYAQLQNGHYSEALSVAQRVIDDRDEELGPIDIKDTQLGKNLYQESTFDEISLDRVRLVSKIS